jgi:endonuclease/exonuclease/phosphatase family metal-dependent hydrolase
LAACSHADETDSDSDVTAGPVTVRVMTWNVQSLGAVGTADFTTAEAVVARVNPDVLGFCEIVDVDLDDLATFASDLGYGPPVVADTNPFGEQRQAILTRLPIETSEFAKSPELSGDSRANDITRWPVFADLTLPNGAGSLRVISEHWKSGDGDTDQFRRTVDGLRVAQSTSLGDRSAPVLAMGDVNADIGDAQPTPEMFHIAPSDLPSSYDLGKDLATKMDRDGLLNNPFVALADVGLVPVDAAQLDGRLTTRPTSGRRIDYIFLDADLRQQAAAQVYDCLDESIGGGLPLSGEAPSRDACSTASDHLPVFVDLTFGG